MHDTIACFMTDIEKPEARAAILLRVDPRDVPKTWVEEARAKEEPLPAYFAVCYEHAGVDEVRFLLDRDRQALVRERRGTSTAEDAEDCALDWVGEDGRVCLFRELPGIYQAAYHDWITGLQWDSDTTTKMWIVPVEGVKDYFYAREFPPPNSPTKLTPDPRKTTGLMLPRYAVKEMYKLRGW